MKNRFMKTENGTTIFFKIIPGVRQGCVLSLMLFIIIMDYALRFASGYRVKVGNKQLFDLDFADDVVLLEESKERLLQLFDTITENVGLKINIDKSKSMAITTSPLFLHCKNKDLEQVQEFKHLGSWIDCDGVISTETKRRIGQATGACNRLKSIWRSNKCSMRLKLRLFNSNVLSILLYVSECWKINTQLEKRILAFENMSLRRVLNSSWQQKITNAEISRKTGQPPVIEWLKRRLWTYLEHVLRMEESHLPRTTYEWKPDGRRKRGRPKNTLRRTNDRDI
ncbi:uncharacterized protein LOC136035457 [Artemia franciscana]|uniref:uncharacterized protein LOC136035457 n=1 Tax=Artemia franciscana TaxID=6661 RepID=UPI0032DB09AD